jgi:nicotinate-nucleotide pyrophosphorylase (carboxylating)
MEDENLKEFILRSLAEDIGSGDHSSLACIPADATGNAKLVIKGNGVLAGIRVAREIFRISGDDIKPVFFLEDGALIKSGDIAFQVSGRQQSILHLERLTLNIMQRMSGIATSTREYADMLKGLRTRILDTRKTTPGFRFLEKEAVRIGGGVNHRMGLYDMIMLKDNHIDYAGGIKEAILRTREYLTSNNLSLKVVIEARNLDDVSKIIEAGSVDRILLDNFTVHDTMAAVKMIDGRYETESSGGITIETIRSYAECGVDYISVGALTHQVRSLDMSLKAF